MKTKLLVIDLSETNQAGEYGIYRFITFDEKSRNLLCNYTSSVDEYSVDEIPDDTIIQGFHGELFAGYDLNESNLYDLKIIFDVVNVVKYDSDVIKYCIDNKIGYNGYINTNINLSKFFSEE